MSNVFHRPSGMMCAACAKKHEDCSSLAFKTMPTMKQDRDGTIVVRCTSFEHAVIKGTQNG
jgi:hypothetical protein